MGLVLFFSLMAGMYYKSSPRNINVAILDEDHSALSRSIIHAISSTNYFNVVGTSIDYLRLQNKHSALIGEENLVCYSKFCQQLLDFIYKDETRVKKY